MTAVLGSGASGALAGDERTTAASRLTGELRLRVALRGGRSTVVDQFHVGSLRVLRAHHDASGVPTLMAINPGGGYLGGDAYETRLEVGAGASALLTTQSATKVYRTPQGPARAELRLVLGAGARLESVPDALIAYRDARYHQDTVVDMAPDASLALAEVVTHGWSPDGEPFRFDEVSLVTRVRLGGRLAVADNLLIRPGDGGPGAVGPGARGSGPLGPGSLMLGGRTHVGSLLVVDPRADDGAVVALRALLAERFPSPPAGPLVGVTRLAVPGFALRALADSTQSAEAVLVAVLDWMRAAWQGLPPIELRKL
ncbi:urease accessory protein UreD [Sinomonas sp. JGH33]|uniref:Urease accessory protein UreD n=1 Tax=Sinomonas terricola TaxID=3110330 RepID=A0ABU5T358_9MICC|nr:urease accessory protein UreD [Sinomonas sp. JGH33]MEA5454090.1 urease accessory protein UreD [Sinomonas sp. JGH33]